MSPAVLCAVLGGKELDRFRRRPWAGQSATFCLWSYISLHTPLLFVVVDVVAVTGREEISACKLPTVSWPFQLTLYSMRREPDVCPEPLRCSFILTLQVEQK